MVAPSASADAAFVRRDERATVHVGGRLDRTTVARLHPELQRALAGAVHVNLSKVTHVDSAGVALLSVVLAGRVPAVEVVPPPPGAGLDELRGAYRLDETLAFA